MVVYVRDSVFLTLVYGTDLGSASDKEMEKKNYSSRLHAYL